MIRVGFWYDRPIAYSGGLNYVRNLLYAISLVNRGRINPYLFLGTKVSDKDAAGFGELATVVRTPLLDRKSIWWFLDRLLVKLLHSQFLVKRELRKYGIRVVSHAEHVTGLGRSFRVISWFPDFQFLHLPKFFPGLDAKQEIGRLGRMFSGADAIILSSHAAFADFRTIAPAECVLRARVLQFASQSDIKLNLAEDAKSREAVERRYGFKGKYFYLPNQFWMHKNHLIVFKAVAELKARGVEVLVICTGNLNDYRLANSDYVEGLKEFIAGNGLKENVLILGMVPYEDVLVLMWNCLAVINPSRFEGWSSTVEEAKSTGKKIVLSNIPVHLEQNPRQALYFGPDDVAALGRILEACWTGPDFEGPAAKTEAAACLRERTLRFGEGYIELVEQVELGHLDT